MSANTDQNMLYLRIYIYSIWAYVMHISMYAWCNVLLLLQFTDCCMGHRCMDDIESCVWPILTVTVLLYYAYWMHYSMQHAAFDDMTNMRTYDTIHWEKQQKKREHILKYGVIYIYIYICNDRWAKTWNCRERERKRERPSVWHKYRV